MSLVILEGMDKTGKSTVAEYFRKKEKYDYVHMTAPARWHTRDSYFAEMLLTIAMTAGKNVVIDRSWYGELVWPAVYGRTSLLSSYDCKTLMMVAQRLHNYCVNSLYMHDPDKEAHIERLRKYKEPQFNYDTVVRLYEWAAADGAFQKLTFQEAEAKGWT